MPAGERMAATREDIDKKIAETNKALTANPGDGYAKAYLEFLESVKGSIENSGKG